MIDFAEWPADWSDFTDAQLCELLRHGAAVGESDDVGLLHAGRVALGRPADVI